MKNSVACFFVLFLVLTQTICCGGKKTFADNDPTMVKISANDPAFVYVGRVLKLKNGRVRFSFPGVSIKANFQGDALDIVVNDLGLGGAAGTNYLNVIIDNGTPIVVRLSSDVSTYQIARNLSNGTHSLEIFKRTESSVGTIEFEGIKLRKGYGLGKAPSLPSRKMLFIGNSITCGFGNDTIIPSNPNSGFQSRHENNYNAYGAITARALNAQYIAMAYSGRGLIRNYDGSTNGATPLIYDHVIPDNDEYIWKHSDYVPDIIVINVGTNDFSAERQGLGVVDSAVFVQTYLDFIKVLKQHHPQATIICTVGCMMTDFYPQGAKHWTRIQNYVGSVVNNRNKSGDGKTYYLKFDPQTPPYGEDWHPSTATHTKMSTTLVNFIAQLSPWSTTEKK